MADIFKKMGIEEAKALLGGFEYALLYNIEGIALEKIDGMAAAADFDEMLKECYEARFFDSRRELRLFRDDAEGVLADWKTAVMVSDPSDGECHRGEETICSADGGSVPLGSASEKQAFWDEKSGIGGFTDAIESGRIIWQDKKYKLANLYRKNGNAVIIRQYLVPDDDGQMCVKATRLVGIEV